jgi:hypothetical protein
LLCIVSQKKPSHRWSVVADLHTNTCNKTDIQQRNEVVR